MVFREIDLKPENKTFADIMSNGRSYGVPQFQRDYSWEEEQLDELWQDIKYMEENREQHFMGYLVLESKDNMVFEIIDGQQRITTITLLIIAALNRFKQFIDNGQDTDANRGRLKHYHDTFLGVYDPVNLTNESKLRLNRNNNRHFKAIVDIYDVPRLCGVASTNRLMNKALEFFHRKIEEYNNGKDLAEFIKLTVNNLLFTTITVKDKINAYIVFETLNARGVQLSAPDLLKNYLLSTLSGKFSTVNPCFTDFEDTWSAIIEQLGEADFTAFLRSHRGIYAKLPAKKDLFRTLKKDVAAADKVIAYIKDIARYAPVYNALQNPGDAFWKDYDYGRYNACTDDLEVLGLYNIKTPLSLLMASYYKYSPVEFNQVVKWITVISIRYNVICDKASSDQEKIYNNLAMEVNAGSCSFSELKAELKKRLYPDDEEFKYEFSTKRMPGQQSSKKILYLLRQIEKHSSGSGTEVPANITLEHVLPQNPDNAWQEYFGLNAYNEAIQRLGNMALLSGKQNRDIGGADFSVKRNVLENSDYTINSKIAEYERWDIDAVNNHQKWLARQATAVWKID